MNSSTLFADWLLTLDAALEFTLPLLYLLLAATILTGNFAVRHLLPHSSERLRMRYLHGTVIGAAGLLAATEFSLPLTQWIMVALFTAFALLSLRRGAAAVSGIHFGIAGMQISAACI